MNEDNENASNKDNENALNKENENALNEGSENASNEGSENASNENNESASSEDNENASNEDAVIKSESAELSEKEKKINFLINSLNKLEDKKEIKIVLQEMEEAVKIYNKKIFEILEKYLENINESDKSKFQKIKTLRNFKTITSSSESNLILENETEKITAEIKIEKEDFKKIAEINKAKKQSIYETIEKYISTIDSKL